MYNIQNNSSVVSISKLCLLILIFFGFVDTGRSQSTTSSATSWSTSSSWNTNAVPAASGAVNVNNPLTISSNINCLGNYTINAAITDPAGGADYNLVLGDNNTTGTMIFYANGSFGGKLTLNQAGILYVKSGATLTIGEAGDVGEKAVFEKDCKVVIESGGTLIINGDVTNMNQSNDFEVNGSFIVKGTLTATGAQSSVYGTGNVVANSYTGVGLIMGVQGSSIV
ncbi:MAG TPA: hypothetical protein VF691_11990, partial [Cytophagaceae bacterium]